MRTLAIIVAKLLVLIGRLAGKGSVTPGAVALRICPTLAKRLVLPPIKIAVTGSSGKGSTSTFIADSLRALGYSVVHNSAGSNMRNGIITMLLRSSSLSGRIKADALVAEVDERSCKHVFDFLEPDMVVITNITRDQPPRQRHTDFIFEEIYKALSGKEHLILNGDDPLLMRFSLVDGTEPGSTAADITTYGLTADCGFKSSSPRFDAVDAAYCPLCASRLEYRYHLFESQGAYRCPEGHYDHHLDMAVNMIERGVAEDGSEDVLVVDNAVRLQANSRLHFNVCNVMAAYTTLSQLSLPHDEQRIATALSQQTVSKKIFNYYQWQGRRVYVLNNKAENATTFNQSVLFTAELAEPVVLVVGWMEISRRYDSDDLAWLYDVNFDLLANQVTAAVCTGIDAETIAVRLKYAGIPEERISVSSGMDARVAEAIGRTEGPIVAILNFDHVQPFIDLTDDKAR